MRATSEVLKMSDKILYKTISDNYIHCMINTELDLSRHLTTKQLSIHLTKPTDDNQDIAGYIYSSFGDVPAIERTDFEDIDKLLDETGLKRYDFSYYPVEEHIERLTNGIVVFECMIEDSTYNSVDIAFFGFGDTYQEAVNDLFDTFKLLNVNLAVKHDLN